jgi:2-methylcitrate dehydratase PrpD
VVTLRGKVRARIDPALGKEQAGVSIVRKDGARHELRVEHCAGSLQRPLTDAELDAKFFALCEPVLGAAAPALAALRGLAQARDAGDVGRRLAVRA